MRRGCVEGRPKGAPFNAAGRFACGDVPRRGRVHPGKREQSTAHKRAVTKGGSGVSPMTQNACCGGRGARLRAACSTHTIPPNLTRSERTGDGRPGECGPVMRPGGRAVALRVAMRHRCPAAAWGRGDQAMKGALS